MVMALKKRPKNRLSTNLTIRYRSISVALGEPCQKISSTAYEDKARNGLTKIIGD